MTDHQPLQPTPYADILQAEACTEMQAPEAQPVISPEQPVAWRKVHQTASGPTYGYIDNPQHVATWLRAGFPLEALFLAATPQPVIAPALSLTHKMIDTAYRKVWSTVTHRERLAAFAYEIEAALIAKNGDIE